MRDILLGQIPPQAFLNYVYLTTAVVTAFLVFLWTSYKQKHNHNMQLINDTLLNFFDAAGLGVFSVIGVQNGIRAGFEENAFFCIFLGMLTGVGGGVLRDMMSRSTPAILRKHVYALASIAGSICYYFLHFHHRTLAILVSTILVVIIRMLARHYQWTLPRIPIS